MNLHKYYSRLCITFLLIVFIVAVFVTGCASHNETAGTQEEAQNGISEDSDLWQPTQPIRIIVSFAPGGAADTFARGISPFLSAELGVPVIVENMAGAGTRIANQYVFDADPDGYTLLFTLNSELTVGQIAHDVRYDTEKFAYIDTYFKEGAALVVSSDSPYETVEDLIEARKEKGIRMGLVGSGGYYHLITIMMAEAADIDIIVIPYEGGGPIVAALQGGHIDAGMFGMSLGHSNHRDGTLRCIAQMADYRNDAYPDYPAITESLPEWDGDAYIFGINGPPDLPEYIRHRLEEAYQIAIANEDFINWAENIEMSVTSIGSEAFKNEMI